MDCQVRGNLPRRAERPLLALAVCTLLSSCAFYGYGIRNLVHAPLDAGDRCVRRQHLQKLADEAWEKVQEADPQTPHSVHFVLGFKSGFADYLETNRTGEPPLAPPWIYRSSHFDSPEGHQAIDDWFAGFRHGSVVAQESGYRQFVALPLSAQPLRGRRPPPTTPAATAEPDQLPYPRELEPVPPNSGAAEPGAVKSAPPSGAVRIPAPENGLPP
jgi:hypothetical protein